MSRMPYRRMTDAEIAAAGLPPNRNGYSVATRDPSHYICRDSWRRAYPVAVAIRPCPAPWEPWEAAHYV